MNKRRSVINMVKRRSTAHESEEFITILATLPTPSHETPSAHVHFSLKMGSCRQMIKQFTETGVEPVCQRGNYSG
jgi:hypothetical protein